MLPENAVLVYGGSVNNDNIDNLAAMNQIKGVLVGNASLEPDHFYQLALKFGA
jgi:triosephosphate isomerase